MIDQIKKPFFVLSQIFLIRSGNLGKAIILSYIKIDALEFLREKSDYKAKKRSFLLFLTLSKQFLSDHINCLSGQSIKNTQKILPNGRILYLNIFSYIF